VRAGYLALAGAEPDTWVVVEGSGDLDSVSQRLLDVVVERLGPLPTPVR
jgi:thymidylate kinase